MTSPETIRITASILSRVRDDEGRYALIENKGTRLREDRDVLTPIGGSAEVLDGVGRASLMELLGIEDTNFEKGLDLRIRNVSRAAIPAFLRWFGTGLDRETNPLRELREELVDETKIVPAAYLLDTEHQLVGYDCHYGISHRRGSSDHVLRVAEVHDVLLPQLAMIGLLHGGTFVTAEEIRNRQTNTGVEIGAIADALIAPRLSALAIEASNFD